jgi:hypothetical protein
MSAEGGSQLFIFEITGLRGRWEAPYDADLYVTGTGELAEEDHILQDPTGTFPYLPIGAVGLALKSGSLYYMIQAACPVYHTTEEPTTSTEATTEVPSSSEEPTSSTEEETPSS